MAGKIRLRGATSGFTQIESVDEAPENTVVLPTQNGDLIAVDTSLVEPGDTIVYVSEGEGEGQWVVGEAAAGARGGDGDKVFWENDTQITASYTITTNKNAMTAGPVEIVTGADVEIPAGSVWTIV
jgi:hypothetical protein